MDTWSKQSGFPVVTVNKDGNDLVISQKAILLAKAESKKAKTNDDEEEEEEGGEKPKE